MTADRKAGSGGSSAKTCIYPFPISSYIGQNVFQLGRGRWVPQFPKSYIGPQGPYSKTFNPLSHSIHMQILQTDHHTFPFRFVERI